MEGYELGQEGPKSEETLPTSASDAKEWLLKGQYCNSGHQTQIEVTRKSRAAQVPKETIFFCSRFHNILFVLYETCIFAQGDRWQIDRRSSRRTRFGRRQRPTAGESNHGTAGCRRSNLRSPRKEKAAESIPRNQRENRHRPKSSKDNIPDNTIAFATQVQRSIIRRITATSSRRGCQVLRTLLPWIGRANSSLRSERGPNVSGSGLLG